MKEQQLVLTRRVLVVTLCAALVLLAVVAGRFISRGQTAAAGYALVDPSLAVPVTVDPDDDYLAEEPTPSISAQSPASESPEPQASESASMFIPSIPIYEGQPDNGSWIWPAQSRIVTSPFGIRSDPFTGRPSFHSGIDIGAACGDEIWASREGTVTFAGVAGGYGNRVVIDHGNGFSSTYSHLHTILVKSGQHVQQRQTIGQNGTTGRSTGCHLHYEIMAGSKFADPMPFLTGSPSSAATAVPQPAAVQPANSDALGDPAATPTMCAVAVNTADAASFGGLVPVGQQDNCMPVTPSSAASQTPTAIPAAPSAPSGGAPESPSQPPVAEPQPAAPAVESTTTPEPSPSTTPNPGKQPAEQPSATQQPTSAS